MTASKTATVETLTAEVRVLMVGSRQVTMGVYGQLDYEDPGTIEPFGRVKPTNPIQGYVYVVGRRTEDGALVRSKMLIHDEDIKTQAWRNVWNSNGKPRSTEGLEDQISEEKDFLTKLADDFQALPLIVLAGLR